MSCGCPVVTAHNSAMIEVVAGAGKTVMGWAQTEWVQSILEVYANRVPYAARGLQRARQYDWQELGGRLLARLQPS